MKSRRLGATGLEISLVGFGGWAIGGNRNTTGGLGAADDGEALAAIRRALDLGVNWIDTAPGYGAGHSEELVGQAIRGMHKPPLVFTKCGFTWDERLAMRNQIDPESIRREVEASLRRLGTEALDLYQIHWVEPELDSEIEVAWTTLAELRREGKIRHIGVSNFTVRQLSRAQSIAPVETLQPPYSLLERSFEGDLATYCRALGLGVVVYSPMQTGLLTGRMTRERVAEFATDDARLTDPQFLEPQLSVNLDRVDRLSRLASKWGWSAAQAAIAWTLRDPVVAGAIAGFRNPGQVDDLLGRGISPLSPEQLAQLEAIGWH